MIGLFTLMNDQELGVGDWVAEFGNNGLRIEAVGLVLAGGEADAIWDGGWEGSGTWV
jgi:hypothetical protein